MVAQVTGVTDPNSDGTTLDVAWRRMLGRDGVRGDFTGGGFAVDLSTVSPTLTVAAAGRSILVDGNLVTFPADVVLDPRDVGALPTAGQSRRDYVVARYDSAVALISARGSLAIAPGTPGTNPTLPALSRTPAGESGVFDVVVGDYRLPADGLLTSWTDHRVWAGDLVVVAAGTPLGQHPLGTVASRGADLFVRTMVGGQPAWLDLLAGPYAAVAQEAAARAAALAALRNQLAPPGETEEYVGGAIPDSQSSVPTAGRALAGTIFIPSVPYARTLRAIGGVTTVEHGGDRLEAGFILRRYVAPPGTSPTIHNRRVKVSVPIVRCTGTLTEDFDLAADTPYSLQWYGTAVAGTGSVRVTVDPALTFFRASTRGVL